MALTPQQYATLKAAGSSWVKVKEVAESPFGAVPPQRREQMTIAEQVRSQTEQLMERVRQEGLPQRGGSIEVLLHQQGASLTATYRVKNVSAGAFVERSWAGEVRAGGRIEWRS